MSEHSKFPKIYDYLDIGNFLRDYYSYRKFSTKGFSYEAWAQELGINNRSFLRLITVGKKKITPQFTKAFCEQVFATKNEKVYFAYLVTHSQGGTQGERQLAGRKMLDLIRHEHSAQIVTEKVDYISDPLLPRLLSLLCFSDLRATTEICAKLLKMDVNDMQKALETLAEMGLAESVSTNEGPVWIAKSDTFHVPDIFGSMNLIKYHSKSLEDAILAFSEPKNLRKYKSLLVPMNEQDLEKFNQALEDFISEQLMKYNTKYGLGRYLYQVNFNFHPITEKMESV